MKHKGRRRYQEKQKGKVTKEVEERKSKIKQFGVFFLMIYPRSAFIFLFFYRVVQSLRSSR